MRHFLLAWLCAPVLLAQPVVYQGEFLYHEIETVVERRCDSSPLVTERNKETTGALAQISFDERTFSCPWATFSGKLTFLIPTIKLSAGDGVATLRVPLRANGISSPIPDIDVTPSRLDFGRVSANQASDQTLTIRNYGPARLNVSAITATNARYTVASGGATFALEAGSSRTVTVRFRPVSVATETGALDITSDDPNRRTVRVDLTGIGN